ncbi:hypothetical protein FOZ61_003607 [Perkinsus olseni]|uniref:Uncharacterized protein n=1 Tax=Perkinsus olseni TaxID=32597 RepID=A0A7J6KLB1_PEROL|nr:hypothetical protein FOZ61_003607 [Perkinsus olseni]
MNWKVWCWSSAGGNGANSGYVLQETGPTSPIVRPQIYTVLDDPLSNIKARRFLSWIQELEETRFADILSRFHEQLDQQAEKRLIKPSVALGYALTASGSCPVPDALRVNHLSLTPDQVTQLASLQRVDETTYQGIRVMDIMKVIDKDRLGVPLDLPKVAEKKIRSWLYHSMWPVQHPNASTTAVDGGPTLLYVLSSSRTLFWKTQM